MPFFIAYADMSDQGRPATRGGRVMAYGQKFDTREAAEQKIAKMNAADWLHVVESSGELKAEFPLARV